MEPETSKQQMPARDRRNYLIFICLGCAVAFLAMYEEARTLREFYLDTAQLAPGTEIRPLGIPLHLGLMGAGIIIFTGYCSFVGAMLSFKCRRWLRLGIALVPFIFGLIAR